MTSVLQLSRLAVLASLPFGLAVAQTPADASAGDGALLAKACTKMAGLRGVAFATVEAQDNAMIRRFGNQMPGSGDTEVKGEWCKGVTRVQLNLDADEVVLHGGRAAARSGGEWKVRRNSTASGEPLPFVLDPELTFKVLQSLPAEQLRVAHREDSKFRGQDLLILTATLEGDAARDVALTGVFPSPSAGGGMMMMRQMRHMGGGDEPTTIDLAFYVDPKTSLVHRLRVKIYQESAFAGQIRFQTQGGEEVTADTSADEDVKETDEQGNRVYKKGLPVRKLGENTSLADLDVTFSEHDAAFTVELSDALRDVLHLSAR